MGRLDSSLQSKSSQHFQTLKIKRKAIFDGWEREVEEGERAFPSTKEQIKKMHMVFRNNLYMCLISFPQHLQFNVTKVDLDDWEAPSLRIHPGVCRTECMA